MTRKPYPSLLAIRKAILPLNNAIPTSITSIWLEPKELHQRLLLAGVRKSLSLHMVLSSLRRYNSGEAFMAKTKHGGLTYYRSKAAHLEDTTNSAPMQQLYIGKTTGRKRRVQSNPARDCFIGSPNMHFAAINDALLKLEDKENEEQAKIKNEKQREKSKLCVVHITILHHFGYC